MRTIIVLSIKISLILKEMYILDVQHFKYFVTTRQDGWQYSARHYFFPTYAECCLSRAASPSFA